MSDKMFGINIMMSYDDPQYTNEGRSDRDHTGKDVQQHNVLTQEAEVANLTVDYGLSDKFHDTLVIQERVVSQKGLGE